MARASSGLPDVPTAAALSYWGRSNAALLARRATRPPSSSMAVKSGVSLACCKSSRNWVICCGLSRFLPKITTPPTGYSAKVWRMASVSSVTPSALASLIWSCVWLKSRESGRTRKSCPTFCSSVISSSSCCTRSGSGVGCSVGAACVVWACCVGASVGWAALFGSTSFGAAEQAHKTAAKTVDTNAANLFFMLTAPCCLSKATPHNSRLAA